MTAATNPTDGGAATITVGLGNNLVMGGTAANTITAATGSAGASSIDVLLGANGSADLIERHRHLRHQHRVQRRRQRHDHRRLR